MGKLENVSVRFSYVKYDAESVRKQETLKKMFEDVETFVAKEPRSCSRL